MCYIAAHIVFLFSEINRLCHLSLITVMQQLLNESDLARFIFFIMRTSNEHKVGSTQVFCPVAVKLL